eukprot:PhF_6_TR4238/c0_g1_i2/m.5733
MHVPSSSEIASLSTTLKYSPQTTWYTNKYFNRTEPNSGDTSVTIQASSRIAKHEERRQKLISASSSVSPNLSYVAKSLQEYVDIDMERISIQSYLKACENFGIPQNTNTTYPMRLFEELDPGNQGSISYRDFLEALNRCTIGLFREEIARECFNVFDPRRTGYIVRPMLVGLRGSEELENYVIQDGEVKCTHFMVTAMINVLDEVLRQEEAALMATVKGKKGSAKPPQLVQRKFHINFAEFLGFFDTNGLLIMAFFPIILHGLAVRLARK